MRSWRSLWCVALWALGSCYPSAAHLHCLDQCHAANDRCVLTARDAAGVQSCDEQVQGCLASCPP